MESKKIKKLYYSISEVSQITSLKKYILRYWENEFSDLKPGKNRAGNRIYRLNDIKTIFLIKKLLYQEKYTIEGAKKKLKDLKKNKDPQLELSFEDLRREDTLLEMKKSLEELLDFIDNKEQTSIQMTELEKRETPAGEKSESREEIELTFFDHDLGQQDDLQPAEKQDSTENPDEPREDDQGSDSQQASES